MSDKHQSPDVDTKLLIFQKFMEWIWYRVPISVRNVIEDFLFRISPGVPVSMSNIFTEEAEKNAAIAGGVITFIFCFVGTVIWTSIDGTLYGTDPGRLYFSHDITNILNYAINIPTIISRTPPRIPTMTQPLLWLIVLGIASISTSRYIAECLDPSVYSNVSWYVTHVTPSGQRIISGLGVYYTILNFVLLVICLLAMFSYLAIFSICISIGRALSRLEPENDLSFEKLKDILKSFRKSYLITKWLIFFLMLNAFSWKLEQPHSSYNMVLLGLALSFFGVFFISIH